MKLILLFLLVQWGNSLQAQFSLPLKHLDLTSGFGYRIHPVTGKPTFHAGVDLRAHHDTVYAVADGNVAAMGYQSFLGLYIRLDHDGIQTVYGHLSCIFITTGDIVYSGEAIALFGNQPAGLPASTCTSAYCSKINLSTLLNFCTTY